MTFNELASHLEVGIATAFLRISSCTDCSIHRAIWLYYLSWIYSVIYTIYQRIQLPDEGFRLVWVCLVVFAVKA